MISSQYSPSHEGHGLRPNRPLRVFPQNQWLRLSPEVDSSKYSQCEKNPVLLAPRLLNLLERATFRFRNHLPNEDKTNKGKRAVDRKCSPEVQNLHQAEK